MMTWSGVGIVVSAVVVATAVSAQDYVVVDTGQASCYGNLAAITCPQAGQSFFGQDAQYEGHEPAYTLGSDGLTVDDNNTGLTWQRTPDTSGDGVIDASDKLSWTQAQARPATLNAANHGGYSDWRLPTIKELYSLIDFRGGDPSGYAGTNTSGLTPFIDTEYFDFAYGDTSAGERLIDSQYASNTLYVTNTFGDGGGTMFGVNFADGRIKGYGLSLFGVDKTFFVQCVRGNPDYGINSFVDNDDGTVTDDAAGLMWTQADSGTAMRWESALAWVETMNAPNHLGYSDWRLPNAKELQSIVDYTRSPDTTGSAAIDPYFSTTPIVNEAGQADYPSYWAGTTHAAFNGTGGAGVYIAFGRAMGYLNGAWRDVHGAGAQRSDFKSGDPADYPEGNGPQGDAVRIYNYVRLVRDAGETSPSSGATCAPAPLDDCVVPGKARLKMKDSASPSKRTFLWKWSKGAANVADFGDPVAGTTNYRLCVYDDGLLTMSSAIAAAGICSGKPCWKPTGSKGLKYKNKAGNTDGITQVKLKSGSGNAAVQVKGKGAGLALPFPVTDSSAVSIQLVNDPGSGSQCWGVTFPSPAQKNQADQFLDRAP